MVAGAGRGATGAEEEGVAVAQLTGGVVDGEQGASRSTGSCREAATRENRWRRIGRGERREGKG